MAASASKQITYVWEGKDKKGKAVKGEMRATGDSFVFTFPNVGNLFTSACSHNASLN